MRKFLISAILALAVSGCAGTVVRNEGARIDRDKILELHPGSSTRQSVLDLFGKPDSIDSNGDEEKMVYVFKEKQVPSYFGGIVENEATSKTTSDTLEVVIKNDIVRSYRFRSAEE